MEKIIFLLTTIFAISIYSQELKPTSLQKVQCKVLKEYLKVTLKFESENAKSLAKLFYFDNDCVYNRGFAEVPNVARCLSICQKDTPASKCDSFCATFDNQYAFILEAVKTSFEEGSKNAPKDCSEVVSKQGRSKIKSFTESITPITKKIGPAVAN